MGRALIRRLWLWTPVLVWAGLIFYFSSIPHLKTDLGIGDILLRKAAHMVEYGVLALLVFRALQGTSQPALPRAHWWSLGAALLYAVTDEWHQAFVPGRGPSALDVGFDGAGAFLALWIRRRLWFFG